MAFCTKCGVRLLDDDKFCPMCGTPKYIPNVEPTPSCTIPKNPPETQLDRRMLQYKFYQVFYEKKLFSQSTYIITDRSIIIDSNEYPFSRLTTFFGEGYDNYSYRIDGMDQQIHYSNIDKVFFEVMLVYINSKIEAYSLKQQVRKLAFAQFCYEKLKYQVDDLPIVKQETDKFPEVVGALNIKPIANAPITQMQHRTIANFMYVQHVLNCEYINLKKYCKVDDESGRDIMMCIGDGNKNSTYLINLAKKLKDSDTSYIMSAIRVQSEDRQEAQYRQQLAEEYQRYREEHQCYEETHSDNSGGGFLSNAAATAAGIAIANKINNRKLKEEQEERDKRAAATAREERSRKAFESRQLRDSVIKANQERRRKGQPELPIPPADWY